MWRSLLRSDLPDDFFEDLHYAIFGLGDSSYEKFCWPAKKLSRRLDRLGATAICPRAEGDTQHTLGYVGNHSIGYSLSLRTDGAFDPWLSTLKSALLRLFPLPPHPSPLPAEELPTPRVALLSATSEELRSTPAPLVGNDRYHTFELVKNERITADDWYQDVRHFEFQCQDDLAYAIV
jgi:sulfite reductase alpha subunit-like flavoprotein